jgi:hypothetical protein
VKQENPGGYNWSNKYPVKNSKGQPTNTKEYWIPARDLWERLWVTSRGDTPKKNSVFVMDTSAGYYGHTGIVKDVLDSGKKIKVKHANWDLKGNIEEGYYVRTSTSSNKWKYIKSNGVKGSKEYKIYGFVYKP